MAPSAPLRRASAESVYLGAPVTDSFSIFRLRITEVRGGGGGAVGFAGRVILREP